MEETSRDSHKDIFRDILNVTSQYSYEAYLQRKDYEKEDHVCLKSSRENGIEVTSLTYDQIFKFSVRLGIVSDKLEKMIDLKGYIRFLENINKILGEEIESIRSESLN